jgi:undecaprenyl-diphosphatase
MGRALLRWLVTGDVRMSRALARSDLYAPSPWLDKVATVGAHLGDTWLWVLIAARLLHHAHQQPTVDGGRQVRLTWQWIGALCSAIIVTVALKQGVRRPRPLTASFLYGPGPDVHSFPSGHAMRLGVICAWRQWLWPHAPHLLWLLALSVSWSRVRLGIHYLGDIAVGFALGWGIGEWWKEIGKR